MEQCGYVPVRNDRNEGRWIIKGTRQATREAIYQSGIDFWRRSASSAEKIYRLSGHGMRGPENFGNQIPISGRAMP
jgi:hypothetical protein